MTARGPKWRRCLHRLTFRRGPFRRVGHAGHAGFGRFLRHALPALLLLPAGLAAPAAAQVVSIAGGGGVTEGGTATFTLTATPAPVGDIKVTVDVTEGGDVAADGQTGKRMVTVGTDGTGTLTVTTVADSTDEPDGVIGASLLPGADYTVGPPSSATVQVNDDDPPSVVARPITHTTVTVTGSAGDEAVAEGTAISFTLHLSDPPSEPVTVRYSLSSPRHAVRDRSVTLEAGTTAKTFLRLDTEDNVHDPDGRHEYSVLLKSARGSGLQLAHIGNPSSATATVADNERVVSLAGGRSVTEGGTASFTLTATPAPVGDIEVKLDVADSGSFADSGETGSRTVTVGTGGTAVLEVTTVDDRTDEPKGAITAAVKPGHGYVSGSPSSAAVTVVDNDLPPPFVVSVAGGSSVTEGGTASFTLTMSPAPPAAMTVTVDVTDSGSFAGAGQTGARDVTIATDGTASFTVTTVNDSDDEPNGVIGARVRAGSDEYRAGPPVSAVVSVFDDDVAPPSSKPVVWFGEMPQSVQEGGFINLNVKVHPQLKSPMTIRFSHGGTATVGRDYDIARGLRRSGFNMFANTPGMNIAMQIADDVVEEGDETAVITLVADEAYSVGEPGAYALTIKDSFAPEVSLSPGAGCGCTEGDAVVFTLAAEPAPSAPLAVTLKVTESGDHVGPSARGRRTVTVPVSGIVTVTVPTMNDAVDEPDGTVTATVEAGSGYTLGASSSLAVDVADNDGLPRLSFAERRVDVAESDNPGATTDAVLTVQLSAKSGKPVTFGYAVGGKATAGEDYEAPQPASVTIPPGSTGADLAFKVKDDPRHETLETIFVTLTDPVNALAPSPGNRAVVLISSDDGPPVLSVETSSVVEPPPGHGRYMPFALTLTPASGLDVFVDVADTMTGTASNVHTCYGYCEDYVTGRSRVRFAPGETYKVVHLGVLSDARDEEDETIVVRLSAASKQVTFAEGTLSGTQWVLEVAGTIEDDDTRGIEVTPASLALAAPDGAGSYEVSLTSQPTHIVALDLSSSDPAVATVSPARLTFNPVNWDKPRTVTVTAVDDGNAGGARTATVSHTVAAGTSDYGAVTVPDVTVTVSGSDPALPSSAVSACVPDELRSTAVRLYKRNRWRPPDYAENWFSVLVAFGARSPDEWTADGRTITPMTAASARQRGWRRFAAALECLEAPPPPVPVVSVAGGPAVTEGGTATFTLSAIPAPSTAIAVAVEVADSGDFATDGQTGVRTVTVGTDGTGSLAVPTVNDGADEANGIIAAVVRSGAGYTPHDSDRWASVALADDDDPPPAEPVVSVAAGAAVTEGGNASFTLSASPAPSAPLEVGVTVAASGAFGVSTGSRTVTVPASGSATFTVATADDAADEPDGSVTATVAAGAGYAPHGSEGEAEVAVRDDDEPAPEVSVSAGGAVTEGGEASFTLSADPAPASDLAVTVEVAQDGAVLDATALGARTFTVPAGQAEATFTVATAADGIDEPAGAVTATVAKGDGYAVDRENGGASATVAVADDDATAVALSAPAGDVPEAGGRRTLTVTLGRSLVQGERLSAPLLFGGAATLGSDYTLSAPETAPQGVTYANLASTDKANPPALTFTGPSAASATLVLTASADGLDEGDGETVTVGLGTLAATGLGGGAEGSGAAAFAILEPPPEVAMAAKTASVTEGADAAFTVTASRAPGSDLTVKLTVSEADGSDFVASGNEGAATVTIPKGKTEAAFTVATVDDNADEPDGTVTATLAANGGAYTVAAAPGGAASVKVADNDAASALPTLSVDDATAPESDRVIRFTVRLSKAAGKPVWVSYRTRESTPASARKGEDWHDLGSGVRFGPEDTERKVEVYVVDDGHDEGPETFELVLTHAQGVAIADGVAVGTITNDDPMPAAWLSRFGRTVAEQALDGVAARMAAPRAPGLDATLAGHAVGRGGADEAQMTPTERRAARAEREAERAMAEIARAIVADTDPADPFGDSVAGLEARESVDRDGALAGTAFTLTTAADGAGGSLAFWGRAAVSGFDGREGSFALDGRAVTLMLGADRAQGRWLAGLALLSSSGEGAYRDTDPRPHDADRAVSQACASLEAAPLCRDAVREGDGTTEATLTAVVPYAAVQASDAMRLWAALGRGTGEVTLTTGMGESLGADIDWTMAAAGLRGEIAPHGPLSLAVTSDALWTRTGSERTDGLAASESDTTRLRLGIEAGWTVALDGGGSLSPRLELGLRHDGGDAETGLGVEAGGGVAWRDPGSGLSLGIDARRLLAHESDGLGGWGMSVDLEWDPRPDTKRGWSARLSRSHGGASTGGVAALLDPSAFPETEGDDGDGAWRAEAAHGRGLANGMVGGPYARASGTLGAKGELRTGYRIGPDADHAEDATLDLWAQPRTGEGGGAVGAGLEWRW